MKTHSMQNRRDFLKFSSACLASLAFSVLEDSRSVFAKMLPDQVLPTSSQLTPEDTQSPPNQSAPIFNLIKQVLENVPDLSITPEGYLYLHTNQGAPARQIPLAPTMWNQENRKTIDRLVESSPWALVLHWFGDRDGAYQNLGDYMNGFNSYHLVNLPSKITPDKRIILDTSAKFDPLNDKNLDHYSTSAHFLVGAADPVFSSGGLDKPPAIVQTQAPDQDGVPFQATHVGPVDLHHTYFLDAQKKLRFLAPEANFAFLDFHNNPGTAVNRRTIGIEVCGYNFDAPGQLPPVQQLANLLGVMCAVMKRYRIEAQNILGHHELQTGKADPGKKFLALMRFLVGVKALMDGDSDLQALVFGPFSSSPTSPTQGVQVYFTHLRQYLALVSNPLVVYEWEKLCNYWLFYPLLTGDHSGPEPIEAWVSPLREKMLPAGMSFLSPATHEGLDLYPQTLYDRRGLAGDSSTVRIIAQGQFLYSGPDKSLHGGQSVVFRHTQSDGSRILSVYGNLQRVFELQVGSLYPAGYPVGAISKDHDFHNPFFHLAIAGDALWEDGLGKQPALPLNAGYSWIKQRYLDPLIFLKERGILD